MMAFRWRMTDRVHVAMPYECYGSDDVGQRGGRGGDLVEVGRLDHALEVEHPRVEGAQLAAPDDREARDARLPRAGRDLAGDLALQGLLVDAPLADDHRARRAHARVEVQGP